MRRLTWMDMSSSADTSTQQMRDGGDGSDDVHDHDGNGDGNGDNRKQR